MKRAIAIATLAAALLAPMLVPAGATGASSATPSAAQLSARWWQFVFSLPLHDPPVTGAVHNPLIDQTGSACSVGQHGPIWFLVGVFNTSGEATRTCTIPSGKTLFFPILNAWADNTCVDPPVSVAVLRSEVKQFLDGTNALHATVDGHAISEPFHLRVQAPTFGYTLPPRDNLDQFLGCNVAGHISPAVGDGYYVTLPPLSRGAHTIDFGGTIGPPNNFTLHVVYHLTIR